MWTVQHIDFNEYDAGEGITEEELAENRQGMLTVREKYRELYKRMVKDLYNTGGRQKFLSVESRMNKNPDIGIYRETEADTLIALLVRCRNAVSGYENASAVLQAKLNATPYSKWQESYYDIQYWVHVSDAIADEYEAYIKALNEVLTAEARFRNAYASRRVVEEEDYYEFDEEGQLVWVHIPAEDVKDEYSGEAYATIEQSYDSVMDSMFTYDTYVKEGKYALAMEKKPDREITLNNYKEVYETQDTAWEAEDMKFTANKTVTNKMKNQANNYSFCNEIEYIIYGGTNANNRAASYGTIFGIRYAMNIAPVFSKYWNDQTISLVASTISTSTSGIIPAPLIKLIICLGMTAAETAVDISCLKAGLPVLLVKTTDELYLQLDLEELAEGATELAGKIIQEKDARDRTESGGLKLAYSDYLAVFLYIAMLVDEEGVYLRVADVIQCNMDCHDGEYKGDYLLSNAVTYYQLQADVRVKPLMLALPWSVQNGSNILDSSNWNTFHVSEIRGY